MIAIDELYKGGKSGMGEMEWSDKLRGVEGVWVRGDDIGGMVRRLGT